MSIYSPIHQNNIKFSKIISKIKLNYLTRKVLWGEYAWPRERSGLTEFAGGWWSRLPPS